MDEQTTTGRLVEPSRVDEAPLMGHRPQFYIPVTKPRVTWILLACNVVMFMVTILFGLLQFGSWNLTSNLLPSLVIFGAKVNELIAQGQVWRLFTATFLHADILHLLFNLYALIALGKHVETYFGHGRFLVIYVIAGLWGSFASYATSSEISVGASGAIFGLAGATVIYFWRYHENFGDAGRSILQNIMAVVAFNLVFGFTNPQIDNAGHIGGLIGGAVIALGLLPTYSKPQTIQIGGQPLQKSHRLGLEIAWVIVHLVLLAIGVNFISQRILAG
ncbi:MAG: rhomboid family intramembrane serine protease [Caldilineaceae bacterium]|nr:rhomboid family intramembrane serine protease [Caldilineaceae bacterium]